MNTARFDIKYFVYARKSSESDEKQVQSIDDQLRIMKDLARDLNLTVVKIYSESHSAKEPQTRSVFGEMLAAIQAGEADGILTWKLNRLSRNPVDSGAIQWLLQREQIKSIQTVGREYLPGDNAIVFSVESGMDNQYIRDLSHDVKRGLNSKLEKGIAPILAPIGYLNTKTEVRGENYIIKDPERFHLIRKAWDLMLTGNYSGPMILDILNNKYGLRIRKTKRTGGKPLSRSAIYRIFSEPFYAGQFRYRGTLYEGVHEPMVTREEFDRVQVLLGRPGKPKCKQHTYAYTGLLRCGECGGLISATHKEKTLQCTGKRKSYTLYYCIPARKNAHPCSQRHYVNSCLIDEQIKSEIKKFTILPEVRDWALTMLKDSEIGKVHDAGKTKASQQKAIGDAQRQLDRLTDMCARELLPEDEYKAKRTQLVNSIVTLKGNVRSNEERLKNWRQNIIRVLDFATGAYERFENGDDKVKRCMFSTIRLNSTLELKKLALQKVFWLAPIEKYRPGIEREIQALELRFGRGTEGYNEALTSLSPLVQELVDAVGAEVTKQEPCPGV